MTVVKEDIISALKTVYDPEIPVNVWDMGLIYDIDIQDTEIVILPECDHANGMYRQTAMYQNSIIEFVNKYLGK